MSREIVYKDMQKEYNCAILFLDCVSFIDSTSTGAQANGTDGAGDGLKTAVACEGQWLRIGCDGHRLEVVRANFGRFSIAVCNPAGDTHYAVNCQSSSKTTLKILLDRYVLLTYVLC